MEVAQPTASLCEEGTMNSLKLWLKGNRAPAKAGAQFGVRDWAPAFAGARGRMIRSRRSRGLASLAAGLLLGATPARAQLEVHVTGGIDSSLKIGAIGRRTCR